jgi:uncharacterized membrane protein YhiD involved in acid resistance
LETELLDSIKIGIETFSAIDIMTNLLMSLLLSLVIAYVYRKTHSGLSYSQSFVLTLIYISIVVTIVMMVIGSSLARAFALVGALSIIRFRTVVKDTKDMVFIFFAMSIGMAVSTQNFLLAGIATFFTSTVMFIMHYIDFGSMFKSQFIVRFFFSKIDGSQDHIQVLNRYTKRASLLHIESGDHSESVQLTFDVVLKDDFKANELVNQLSKIDGVSGVTLIASKNDVDY